MSLPDRPNDNRPSDGSPVDAELTPDGKQPSDAPVSDNCIDLLTKQWTASNPSATFMHMNGELHVEFGGIAEVTTSNLNPGVGSKWIVTMSALPMQTPVYFSPWIQQGNIETISLIGNKLRNGGGAELTLASYPATFEVEVVSAGTADALKLSVLGTNLSDIQSAVVPNGQTVLTGIRSLSAAPVEARITMLKYCEP